MAILCRPAVSVPEYVITMEETLGLARSRHAGHPQLGLALRLIENTGVRNRHLVQPVAETLAHPGFEARNRLYAGEAKARVPLVVRRALEDSELRATDIDLIMYVSCTGFMMPSLTAWLINKMGFRHDTRQLPIAQLGCAAGGAAINRAHDFCTAYPEANALIVACEFCSLCYQPTDLSVGTLLSNGLFGDGVAAAVVRGQRRHRHAAGAQRLVPHPGHRGVDLLRGTVRRASTSSSTSACPEPWNRSRRCSARSPRTTAWDAAKLDFYIIHAGGPRILDDLCRFLGVPPESFRFSRATLTEYGNIASAVVLDALCRMFEEGALDGQAAGCWPASARASPPRWCWAAGAVRRDPYGRRPGDGLPPDHDGPGQRPDRATR